MTAPPSAVLRDYQSEARDAVLDALAAGNRRPLVVQPTGTGKSVEAAAVAADFARRGRRVLAVAHRHELIDQLAGHMTAWCGAERVGVVMADRDEHGHQVVVASIQTLAHKRRRDRVLAAGRVGLVIVDEAHHATLGSIYERLLDAIDAPALGMTATPRRRSRKIVPLFERPVFERSIAEMVKAGWLAAPMGRSVVLPGHLSDIGTATDPSTGERDYRLGALTLWARDPRAIRALVEGTVAGIGSRRTLVFAASVEHARDLVPAYEAAGIRSAVVWGAMPAADRAAILTAWRAGEIQLVTNYGILTEGYDLPEISAIVIARPTQVTLLYYQMIGRGLRPAGNKNDCLIFDATDRFRDPRQVVLEKVMPKPVPPPDEIPLRDRGSEFKDNNELEIEKKRREGDLTFQSGRFPWVALSPHYHYAQTAGWRQQIAKIWLAANPANPSRWRIGVELREPDTRRTRIVPVDGQPEDGLSLDGAKRLAVEYLSNKVLFGQRPPGWWEGGEPSDRQIGLLRWKLGQDAADDFLANYPTAGEVSRLIDAIFTRQATLDVLHALWPQYRGPTLPLPPLDTGAFLSGAEEAA